MQHVGLNQLNHQQRNIDHVGGNVATSVGWVDQDPVTLCRNVKKSFDYVRLRRAVKRQQFLSLKHTIQSREQQNNSSLQNAIHFGTGSRSVTNR